MLMPSCRRTRSGYLIPFAVGGRGRLAGHGDGAATKHCAGNAILATLTLEVVGLR
ncbi:hypothetical protein L837_5111 [Mycobacterium avium MAV_061107_1842]|nr:hypothetical protein L837_5111 [Mycobacterium avium MAV_061107_1842]